MSPDIKVYSQTRKAREWLESNANCQPTFTCILGFTATALIEGISAAGATPQARRYTALADAEFLVRGVQSHPVYPLPPLEVGVSPVLISRAVVANFNLPLYVFNAGLPQPPAVDHIDLGGMAANCVSSGRALPLSVVEHLYREGLAWGKKLAARCQSSYLILSECVVGGTTTALALLAGLEINAYGKVNSSHPRCNHQQKWSVVEEGLKRGKLASGSRKIHPFEIVAAVGDPMQIVAAAMAIAASREVGVLLAGGTQMLAVCALIKAINRELEAESQANLAQIAVGTTRWVAEDQTGDTVTLAQIIGDVPLLGTCLSFAPSRYPSLRAYERGFVKEGVGAGGSAIASHLLGWTSSDLLAAVEAIFTSVLSAMGK